MLPKHPDQFTKNEELDEWIRSLVASKEPEGIRLDYKQTIDLGTSAKNREIAKDITSFANEIGGTLIYGVPQDNSEPTSAPVPTAPYGMDPINGLEERVENIFSTAISPMLPEFRIKRVDLSEYPGKVAYIVWTPESWAGPHMVHGYDDGRFYRRGQFRAVIMSERDVEDRYRRRLLMRTAAIDFTNSEEAKHLRFLFDETRAITSLLIVPMLLIPNRVALHQDVTRNWLNSHMLGLGWAPSMYGARRSSVYQGKLPEREEIEIHRNGAMVAYWFTDVREQDQRKAPVINYNPELQQISEILRFSGKFYQFIGYTGPLQIQLTIQCPRGYALHLGPEPKKSVPLEPSGSDVRLVIEPSAQDLATKPEVTEQEMADGLFRAFGIWEAHIFRAKPLNP